MHRNYYNGLRAPENTDRPKPLTHSPAHCSVTDTPWSTLTLSRQLVGKPSSGKQLEEQKSPQALFCAPVVPESMKQNVEAQTSVLVSLCSSPTGAAQAFSPPATGAQQPQ